MKKIFIVVLSSMILAGCTKEHDILPNVQQVTPELAMAINICNHRSCNERKKSDCWKCNN